MALPDSDAAFSALLPESTAPCIMLFMVSVIIFWDWNWAFMVVVAADVASSCAIAAVDAASEAPIAIVVSPNRLGRLGPSIGLASSVAGRNGTVPWEGRFFGTGLCSVV